jgi:lactobin A/cerein 7B family class IIb bacteriocin
MTDQTLNINELTDLEIDSVNGGVEPVTTTIIVVGVVVAAVGALAASSRSATPSGKTSPPKAG